MVKKIIMNIDYNDEVWIRGRAMAEQDIDELIALCAEHGCCAVNWRVTCLGSYQYRTQRPNRLLFDRDDYMRSGAVHGVSPVLSERRAEADRREELVRHQLETLERLDPPEVAREAARRAEASFWGGPMPSPPTCRPKTSWQCTRPSTERCPCDL